MPKTHCVIFCFVAFLMGSVSGEAQPYTYRSYSLAEGLPQSQVWCGLSDHQGFLWFGTQGGGLCRFDGLDFEIFTTADGLPSNFILSLYQDQDFNIWIGTNQGFCRFDGHQFTAISGLNNAIFSFGNTPDGQILIGSDAGLFRMWPDSNSVQSLPEAAMPGQAAVHAIASTSKKVWAGTNDGLWEVYPNYKQLLPGNEIYDLHVFKDSLWIAAYGKGIYQIKDEEPEAIFTGLPVRRNISLLRGKEGHLFVGTQNNGLLLLSYDNTTKSYQLEQQELSPNNIKDIILDQIGRVWLCSSGGGVACRMRQNFQHFNQANGLIGNRIYALQPDTSGNMWMAVSRKGLQVLDSTGFRVPLIRPPFSNVKYKTICRDSLGQMWVGTEGNGIAVLDTAGWYILDRSSGLPSNWALKLMADSSGNIWGATYDNGLFKITREGHREYTISTYGRQEGLPDLRITALNIAPDGKMWFGTLTGHIGCMMKADAYPIFSKDNGLPPVAIRSIAFDTFGQLWIGTKGKGVFFGAIDEEEVTFTSLSNVYPTTAENIYLMLAGPGLNIWAGSENGVDKIQLDSIGQIKQVRHFNRNDGFLGIETCHDAALARADGSIWFGTMNGLTRYTPGENTLSCAIPSLFFTDVDLFYKSLNATPWANYASREGGILPGLDLPHKQNHLSFSFRAISQLRPEGIQYRWKLEGADEDWSPPSGNTSVNYANLSPGDYRFVVQASIVDCPWSESLTAPFSIAQPFWQAPWFAPGVIVASVLLISWIAWLMVRRIKARERQRREALEVQNRLLQLEQKALQLQMNPHFIFNALTGIQSLVATGAYTKARKRINEFAKLMRSTLYNARKAAISLEDEIDALGQYLAIEQFCQSQPFSYRINTPEGLDTDAILLPPMLLQPFIENAVIHGVSHLTYPGVISIF